MAVLKMMVKAILVSFWHFQPCLVKPVMQEVQYLGEPEQVAQGEKHWMHGPFYWSAGRVKPVGQAVQILFPMQVTQELGQAGQLPLEVRKKPSLQMAQFCWLVWLHWMQLGMVVISEHG